MFEDFFQCIHLCSTGVSFLYQFSKQFYSTYFPSQQALSHINMIKTIDTSERQMNLVAMTTINLKEEVGHAKQQTNDPVLKSFYPAN